MTVPSSKSAPLPNLVISTDFTAELPIKFKAASTFGFMVPSPNCPSSMYFFAWAVVIWSIGCSDAVPYSKQIFSTPVKMTSISASTASASFPAARSFSITAEAPFKRFSCASTGIPPPPQAMTT